MRTQHTFHRDQTESRQQATPARKERRDILSVIADEQARAELALDLDELLRESARRILAVALEAEIDAYIAAYAEARDEHGHQLMRRNDYAPPRQLVTGAGQVEVV